MGSKQPLPIHKNEVLTLDRLKYYRHSRLRLVSAVMIYQSDLLRPHLPQSKVICLFSWSVVIMVSQVQATNLKTEHLEY